MANIKFENQAAEDSFEEVVILYVKAEQLRQTGHRLRALWYNMRAKQAFMRHEEVFGPVEPL